MEYEHGGLLVGVLTANVRLIRTISHALEGLSPTIVKLPASAKRMRRRQVPDNISLIVIDDAADGGRSQWNAARSDAPERAASVVFVHVSDDARCAHLLQRGAEEAIVSGSPTEEIRLRIAARRALLRRAPVEATIGDIQINQSERRVTCAGREVRLTAREWSVLLCLAGRYPHAASIEDVAECVWGEADSDKAYSRVQVYMHYLRNKLAGSETTTIENVRGIGYRIADKAQSRPASRSQASA